MPAIEYDLKVIQKTCDRLIDFQNETSDRDTRKKLGAITWRLKTAIKNFETDRESPDFKFTAGDFIFDSWRIARSPDSIIRIRQNLPDRYNSYNYACDSLLEISREYLAGRYDERYKLEEKATEIGLYLAEASLLFEFTAEEEKTPTVKSLLSDISVRFRNLANRVYSPLDENENLISIERIVNKAKDMWEMIGNVDWRKKLTACPEDAVNQIYNTVCQFPFVMSPFIKLVYCLEPGKPEESDRETVEGEKEPKHIKLVISEDKQESLDKLVSSLEEMFRQKKETAVPCPVKTAEEPEELKKPEQDTATERIMKGWYQEEEKAKEDDSFIKSLWTAISLRPIRNEPQSPPRNRWEEEIRQRMSAEEKVRRKFILSGYILLTLLIALAFIASHNNWVKNYFAGTGNQKEVPGDLPHTVSDSDRNIIVAGRLIFPAGQKLCKTEQGKIYHPDIYIRIFIPDMKRQWDFRGNQIEMNEKGSFMLKVSPGRYSPERIKVSAQCPGFAVMETGILPINPDTLTAYLPDMMLKPVRMSTVSKTRQKENENEKGKR